MHPGTIAFVLGSCAVFGLETLPALHLTALAPAALLLLARRCLVPIGLLVAGFLWALIHSHATLSNRLPTAFDGREFTVTGRVASIPVLDARRIGFDFLVEEGLGPDTARLRLSWYGKGEDAPPTLIAGETWRLTVRLWSPRGRRNPGGFDYETWLFRRGYAARGYVRTASHPGERIAAAGRFAPERIRHALSHRLRALPDLGPSGALVEALTVGVRDRVSEEQREILRRTGTSHLLAISGLHVGLAAGLGFAGARVLAPWLIARVAPLRIGAAAGIVLAAGYAMLAGFALPTRRALIMVIVLLIALCMRRRVPASAGFWLALATVLILDPPAILAPGAWLSFGAVAVLLYAMGSRSGSPGPGLRWRRWILPQAAVTIGLAPFVLLWFAEQPLAGPLANAAAIPWVGVAILPPLLAGTACLLVPGGIAKPAGELLVKAGAWSLDRLVEGLAWIAEASPHYSIPMEPSLGATALAVVGVAVLLAPPGLPGRWIGLLCFTPLLWPPSDALSPGEARLAFLDVGHGLAVVVETRERVLVYDTGPAHAAAIVQAYLWRRGRRKIDVLLVSHGDADHAGGYDRIARRIPIGIVLANEGIPDAEECTAGRSWVWDDVRFAILHPPSSRWRGNDGSCVLRVSTGGGTVLLTGDIEDRGERRLAQRIREVRADLLLAPHHGSRTSSSPDFLEAVAPRYAVISARYRSAWNPRHPEVLVRYRSRGIEIHRTDRDGAVIAMVRASGSIELQHARPGRFWHMR